MTLTRQILILSCSVTAVLAGGWIYGGISMTATAAPAEDVPSEAAITGEQSGPAGQIPAGPVSASIEGMLSAAMYGALPATDTDAEANPDPLRMACAIRIFDPVLEPRGAQAIQSYLRDIGTRGLAVDAALMDRVDLAVISIHSRDPAERGRADLLLSQVFVELADHMRNGPFNDSPGLTGRNEQITPQAEDMARWVVRASGGQDRIATMDEAWDNGAHVRIDLERPIPVHIVYYPVEMNDEGDVVFHRDIYNRDERLIQALGQWELTLPDNGEI